MQLRRLRWVGIWLPLIFVITVELFEYLFLEPILGRWIGHLIIFGIIGVAAVIFTLTVFRAIEKAEAFLRQQNQDLADLNEISQVVSGGLELDRILTITLAKVLAATQSQFGQIYLLDESGRTLACKVQEGSTLHTSSLAEEIPVGAGILGGVAATGQALNLPTVVDLAGTPLKAGKDQQFGPLISVPLRAADKVVGIMNVADRPQPYTSTELRLVTAIGRQVGVAIENAKLHSQVEQQARYLSTLIDSSGNAIISTSPTGVIQSWNLAAEQIYGWDKEEAIGELLPMVPLHLRDEALGMMDRLFHNHETIHNFETERLHKSGDLIPVMVTISPIQNGDGAVFGLLGISTDMREKKQLEDELLQQQRALAVVKERERLARELHDGLGQVLGYINTQSQAARELLAIGQIDQTDAHLARLVEVVQDAHTDVREHILGLRTTDLLEQGLVYALVEYVRRFNQSNNLHANLTIAEEMNCVSLGASVETQLLRIIQEAMTNARKHAKTDQLLVHLTTADNHIRISVEDQGQGFDTQHLSAQTRRRFGLDIMRGRSAEIGATIEIQSEVGHGTRVILQVPCQAIERESQKA